MPRGDSTYRDGLALALVGISRARLEDRKATLLEARTSSFGMKYSVSVLVTIIVKGRCIGLLPALIEWYVLPFSSW